MAAIGIKKAAWDSADVDDRFLFEATMSRVALGVAAVFKDGGGTEWVVWDDRRLSVWDVETLTALAVALPSMPKIKVVRDYPTSEIVQVEVPVRIEVKVPVLDENGKETGETVLVWQDHPTDTELVDVEQSLGDRFGLAVAAQDAPVWIAAAERVPESWSPVGEV